MRHLALTISILYLLFLISCNEQKKEDKRLIFNFGNAEADGFFVSEETRWPLVVDSVKYGLAGKFNSSANCQTDESFGFWLELAEGNYGVKVVLGNEQGASSTTIKAESRRLMLLEHETAPGELDTVELIINVRTPRIDSTRSISLKSREINYVNWDANLSLEFAGTCPSVKSIIIEEVPDVPTIFLTGNSTVVDQEDEPWASWGQMFPFYLKPNVAVANFAESGETLRGFIWEGRLAKIETLIKPGDYIFMEFAHNDQKPGSAHVDPYTTYDEELMKFISLARENDATPVLVTSTNRRFFDENGKIKNTLGDYPDAMRKLAEKENVMLIDLNEMSRVLYEALGVEGSKKALVHFEAGTFPWQDKALADNTHFSTYGAWQLAKCVVKGIQESDSPLNEFLKDNLEIYDPAHPDPIEVWLWPMSPNGTLVKPDGS
jgi:lysophospholipase L1-like esterase